MRDHIQYDFLYDNQFAELKESELIQNRLGILATMEPYIGKYYSTEYVRKRVLRQTDSEIIELDLQIEDEINKGILPDPSSIDPVTGQPLPQPADRSMQGGDGSGMSGMGADSMAMGQVPADPNVDAETARINPTTNAVTQRRIAPLWGPTPRIICMSD